MKICHVAPGYAPNTGGVETKVQQVSERLVERGHKVTVKTADRGAEVPRRERRNGVIVDRHWGLSPSQAFHLAPQFADPRQWDEYDVVHAHNAHSLTLGFTGFSSRVPTIATTYYHGHSASHFRDTLFDFYRPVLRRALLRMDTVVAVSEWERQQVREDLGVDCSVIPLGVEPEKFESAVPLERERPYLLCVARLEDYKGVQHAISALSELPEYDLLIAGDGPYRETLEQLVVDMNVSDQVEFLGLVDHERLPAYFAGADVHVSLSSFESFGLTVAESLTSGTPCVLKRSTALQDWCGRDDIVCVSETTPASVARAVRTAVDYSAPSEPIRSWEDVTDSYEAIYEAVH